MNILVIDPQGLTSERQKQSTEERLLFTLARFAYRINGVTLHLAQDFPAASGLKASGIVHCSINVNLKEQGVVTIHRVGDSMEKAVSRALEAVEPEVWQRVDKPVWPGGQLLKRAADLFSQERMSGLRWRRSNLRAG